MNSKCSSENLQITLPSKIREYFNLTDNIKYLKLGKIVVFRDDGVILYSNDCEKDRDPIGALMSGVWQAAYAVSIMFSQNDINDFYNLSFGSSSSGLYIVPFKVDGKEYYLSLIYFDQLNPGYIKNDLRKCSNNLFNFLKLEMKKNKDHPFLKKNDISSNFLFSDITDKEIDGLFNVY